MNSSQDSKKNSTSRTSDLYVGHVPKDVNEGALLEVFSKYGAVVDVMIRHGTGPVGYGIVKFKNKKDADKVLRQVDKIYVNSHEMEVRSGKRNNQNVEHSNGSPHMMKTVTFAEPFPSMQPFGNVHFLDPGVPVQDVNYNVYPPNENASVPIAVEIMCTNVEDAVTFYGCSISSFEELTMLSIKLNSICPNLVRLHKKALLHKVYGAIYEADRQWYRCRVIQYSPSGQKCVVQYIDFGNFAEVPFPNMVELPEPLKNVSPFAIKCVFTNLMATQKSDSHLSYLHHLVNNRMSLCAFHTWGIPEYYVTKCSCNGIDIIAELVRNGYATYTNTMSPKAISPNFIDRNSCPKANANQKPKKGSASKNVLDTYNGVNKNCNGVKDEETGIQVKNRKNSSPAETHLNEEFVPKKIIKRGSDSPLVSCNIMEGAKNVNHLLKIDSVIASVKVINNIRSLIPLHTYDDLISEAVDLLRNEITISTSGDVKQLVEDAKKAYHTALTDIKSCSEQELLAELKEKRDNQRMELCSELKKFLETFDITLLEKKKKVQETITALESNSTAWLNVYLKKIPDSVEDLLSAFNDEKERKRNVIEMSRNNTDEKRDKFMRMYTELGKEFSLDIIDGKTDDSILAHAGGKKGSWALKFDEALTEFGIALEEERKISTVIEDKSHVSVIQYILQKLDIPKDKIDAKCEEYEEYKALYEDLTNKTDLTPMIQELHELSQIIEEFGSCAVNGHVEISEQHVNLHTALLREDALLVELVKASTQHFPELIREHPELNLEEYQKNLFLLKHSWELQFFPCLEECDRVELSYISQLAQEPVVIKEFAITAENENAFLKKVKKWNEVKSDYLVKVKGLFRGKGNSILYAVVPPVWDTLHGKPLSVPVDYKAALNVLQQVLEGLCDIHARGFIHGAVHPMSVLYNGGKVLLDINYDKHLLKDKLCLKGINFQVPNNSGPFKSADMYSFGCLVLWVLFPNLSFDSSDHGVPDITAFQSIIQNMLHAKDFSSLSALLNVNPDVRPSSRVLRSNGFLKDLRIQL